jgi:hypothetical protein
MILENVKYVLQIQQINSFMKVLVWINAPLENLRIKMTYVLLVQPRTVKPVLLILQNVTLAINLQPINSLMEINVWINAQMKSQRIQKMNVLLVQTRTVKPVLLILKNVTLAINLKPINSLMEVNVWINALKEKRLIQRINVNHVLLKTAKNALMTLQNVMNVMKTKNYRTMIVFKIVRMGSLQLVIIYAKLVQEKTVKLVIKT